MKIDSLDNAILKKSLKSKKIHSDAKPKKSKNAFRKPKLIPSVLMLTTYPPRECGIATYSQDLLKSLNQVFGNSFSVKICALNDTKNPLGKTEAPEYNLNTDLASSYKTLASQINKDAHLEIVMIQHEFGLFNGCSETFVNFLTSVKKPVVIGFHTVLPKPDHTFLEHIKKVADCVEYIIVMTKSSANLLVDDYGVDASKIQVIHHGTHLVKHKDRKRLKNKYDLDGKTVLSTFGLLGPGKSIETTLNALPNIVSEFPDVLFLILGKTHPTLAESEGETYRNSLLAKVKQLKLESHVKFINEFLPLATLLEYLQLTDIYLFTSIDPYQAVSGTFSYAMSSGCPIISTPIPHAKEFLSENKGLLFDFGDSAMLAKQLRILLGDKTYRKNLGLNGLHASSATSWLNSALAHGHLFKNLSHRIHLKYQKSKIKLDHLYRMTTPVGLIQFSKLNQPEIRSGYTLDDNARALIVICENFRLTRDEELLDSLTVYLNFILNCQRYDGKFLNYVDSNKQFTTQNDTENLEDSNGRAIWAMGCFLSIEDILPPNDIYLFERVRACINDFLTNSSKFNSPRAIAFIIKGLTESGLSKTESTIYDTYTKLGSKLAKFYKSESKEKWTWFEPYLTYGNSVLPEAMLDVYKATGIDEYKVIAFTAFNFLLDHLFIEDSFRVISNQSWFLRGDLIKECSLGGQQPIDVAYTILALKNFHDVFPLEGYEEKMEQAFSWFMGNNHLKQIVYNPCTTGCFDGLELTNVNLNQGAESTVSYLMARLAFEEPST